MKKHIFLLLFALVTVSIGIKTKEVFAAVLPVGQSGSWNLIFSDEFEGTSLDTNKWAPCYWWNSSGCTNPGNAELEWYLPQNIGLSGGILSLTARKQTIVASDGKTYNYTSGMITTDRLTSDVNTPPKFSYRYGYAEMRAKVPKGAGIWPAFWMIPKDHSWPPEIDAMEILGSDPLTSYMTIHWGADWTVHQQSTQSYTGPDFSSGWHTFAVDWEPNVVTWYIDGVQRYKYTNMANIPSKEMYLVANLAVGGNWPGSPNSATIFPSDFQIDYIRVWQKAVRTQFHK
jgi:beta-glucanase (GH16 family)